MLRCLFQRFDRQLLILCSASAQVLRFNVGAAAGCPHGIAPAPLNLKSAIVCTLEFPHWKPTTSFFEKLYRRY